MNLRAITCLSLLWLGGCGMFGGGATKSVLTEPPSNWQTYEGQSVTVEGSAGNSTSGPILRFQGGSWIGLTGFKVWGMDVVTRPVGVTGTITQGTGARQGEYVIDVKEWYLQNTAQVPAPAK